MPPWRQWLFKPQLRTSTFICSYLVTHRCASSSVIFSHLKFLENIHDNLHSSSTHRLCCILKIPATGPQALPQGPHGSHGGCRCEDLPRRWPGGKESFVYLIGRILCSAILSIFQLGYLPFYCWVVRGPDFQLCFLSRNFSISLSLVFWIFLTTCLGECRLLHFVEHMVNLSNTKTHTLAQGFLSSFLWWFTACCFLFLELPLFR